MPLNPDKDPWIIFGLMHKNSRRFPQLYQEALANWRSPNKAFVKTMACIAAELQRRMENYKWMKEQWPPDGNAP